MTHTLINAATVTIAFGAGAVIIDSFMGGHLIESIVDWWIGEEQ